MCKKIYIHLIGHALCRLKETACKLFTFAIVSVEIEGQEGGCDKIENYKVRVH